METATASAAGTVTGGLETVAGGLETVAGGLETVAGGLATAGAVVGTVAVGLETSAAVVGTVDGGLEFAVFAWIVEGGGTVTVVAGLETVVVVVVVGCLVAYVAGLATVADVVESVVGGRRSVDVDVVVVVGTDDVVNICCFESDISKAPSISEVSIIQPNTRTWTRQLYRFNDGQPKMVSQRWSVSNGSPMSHDTKEMTLACSMTHRSSSFVV